MRPTRNWTTFDAEVLGRGDSDSGINSSAALAVSEPGVVDVKSEHIRVANNNQLNNLTRTASKETLQQFSDDSCVDRCGVRTSYDNGVLHCACDYLCDVYHSCCRDFHSSCPGVAQQLEYALLTGNIPDPSVISCDDATNVFLVTECPSYDSTATVGKHHLDDFMEMFT